MRLALRHRRPLTVLLWLSQALALAASAPCRMSSHEQSALGTDRPAASEEVVGAAEAHAGHTGMVAQHVGGAEPTAEPASRAGDCAPGRPTHSHHGPCSHGPTCCPSLAAAVPPTPLGVADSEGRHPRTPIVQAPQKHARFQALAIDWANPPPVLLA